MIQPVAAFSTSRDVVVTAVLFKHRHMKVNLRLLRSTGCLARIIILLEPNHSIDDEFFSVIHETGAEIVLSDLAVYTRRKGLHPLGWGARMNALVSMVRHEWFRPWLEEHLQEIDRIFVYDASDTFFQADPFRELADVTGLLLHDEGNSLLRLGQKECGGQCWLRSCFRDRPIAEMEHVLQGVSICCGTIAGDAVTYLAFLRFLMASRYWNSCFVDQAIVNYFLYNGTFQQAGIRTTVKSHASVLHITEGYRFVPVYGSQKSDIFDMALRANETPAVVHWCKMGRCARNFYRRCGFDQLEDYWH
jgi:hypothetical protein